MGRMVSHSYGYGLMDAAAMVTAAKTWKSVPKQVMSQSTLSIIYMLLSNVNVMSGNLRRDVALLPQEDPCHELHDCRAGRQGLPEYPTLGACEHPADKSKDLKERCCVRCIFTVAVILGGHPHIRDSRSQARRPPHLPVIPKRHEVYFAGH